MNKLLDNFESLKGFSDDVPAEGYVILDRVGHGVCVYLSCYGGEGPHGDMEWLHRYDAAVDTEDSFSGLVTPSMSAMIAPMSIMDNPEIKARLILLNRMSAAAHALLHEDSAEELDDIVWLELATRNVYVMLTGDENKEVGA